MLDDSILIIDSLLDNDRRSEIRQEWRIKKSQSFVSVCPYLIDQAKYFALLCNTLEYPHVELTFFVDDRDAGAILH